MFSFIDFFPYEVMKQLEHHMFYLMVCYINGEYVFCRLKYVTMKEDYWKTRMTEASTRRSQQGEEEGIPGPIYDDTKGFIEKGTLVKWGEVFHMFKSHSFVNK
jgi:hypothetical protein